MSARLQALLEEAAAAGTFPCARAVVRWRGRTVFSGGVGVPTVFDLASLTKPMATTAVFLSLWAEGKLEPDQEQTIEFGYRVSWPSAKSIIYRQ